MIFGESIDEAYSGLVQCGLGNGDIEEGESSAIVAGTNFPERLFGTGNHLLLNRFGLMAGLFYPLGGQSDLPATLEPFDREIRLDLPLLGRGAINVGPVERAIGQGERKARDDGDVAVAEQPRACEDSGIGSRIGLLQAVVCIRPVAPGPEDGKIDRSEVGGVGGNFWSI